MSFVAREHTSLSRDVFAEFDVPVGEIEEVLPGVVVAHAQIYLHEGAPLGTFRFADQMQTGFLRGAVGFPGITLDTGANNVFPCGGAAAVARDDVIQIQVAAIKDFRAILTGIVVALEDVVARELHFFFRHAIEEAKQDDAGDADAEGNGVDAFRMRLVIGEIVPLREVVGLEGAVSVVEDDLCVAFEKQGQSAPGGADVNSLPEPV